VRQQLLDAIYAGQPRKLLRDLDLTSNRVFGVTRTDQEWSEKLEAALTAARCEDLQHGTNAAGLHGCVCSECREHQQVRIGRNRSSRGGRSGTVKQRVRRVIDKESVYRGPRRHREC
jgi:hypothetical protein